MSRNTAYAKQLSSQLRQLPAKAMHHVLDQALRQVTMMTVQDSGNAAMNWNVTKGSEATPDFQSLYGIGAVGFPGDKRSLGLKGNVMQVVNAQTEKMYGRFPNAASLAGENVMVLSNNIDNSYYEQNAAVLIAGVSITQSLVDIWTKEAMNVS